MGRIPRDVFEDELVPLFEVIGPIFEMRLMMTFGGENRGFCFVKYTNPGKQRLGVDINLDNIDTKQ